ncbi:MAG: ribosome silencing factor [Armatimonadota bacterium]
MTNLETDKRLEIVRNAVIDQKAENVEVIDLRDRTIIADYFVLASGTSNVHIRSIVDKTLERMKEQGQRADRVEGYSEAKWVLVDYGDVVLHVFAPEEREFYDLESLWRATEERLAAK